MGTAFNGVPFFSPNSGQTETLYLYGNIAVPLANINVQQTFTINSVWEAMQDGEDPGAGFPNANGAYQYFSNPYLSYTQTANTHSPLLGFAWDGYPIYGPYGFVNPDGSGGVMLNTSSYQLKTTPRLDANGYSTVHGLQLANYAAPTGQYIEDYQYIAGSGTLDSTNGKLCVTPEYPMGTYAYFTTVNPSNTAIPVYPYIIGPSYNGEPFGLKYVYSNGINTPIYPNGNVVVTDIPVTQSIDFIRSPDGTQPTDALTLQEPAYTAWSYAFQNNQNLARKITTNLRFDRVGPTIEYLDVNASYAIGDVVYSNSGFIQAVAANANASTIGNTSFWISASEANIDISTAVNRITASYEPTTNMFSNQARLLMSGVEYPGVVVNGGNFIDSYTVPTGSLFDIDDPYSGFTALNISWRPELISQTSLSREYSRFGNSSGILNAFNYQYLSANISSPGINAIAINGADFTLEFFMNFSELTTPLQVMADTRTSNTSANGMVVYYSNGNLCIGSNSTIPWITANGISFTSNRWEFITINGNTYGNSNIYTYMNGILVGNVSGPYNFSDVALTLGGEVSNSNISTGYMDELRLTINTNRYPLRPILDANADILYYTPFVNIPVPYAPFPKTLAADQYFSTKYTPVLWNFESLKNDGPADITFDAVNAPTVINDLSWNKKQLQLVNYGAKLIIDSSVITNDILAIKLNQDGN